MAGKAIYYSNFELSNISGTHEWIIPNFETWINENAGQWLNDRPFSPVQGVQLQVKILGLIKGNARIFLKNCGPNQIHLSSWSVEFNFLTPKTLNRFGLIERESTAFMITKSSEDFILEPNDLSEEFPFNWQNECRNPSSAAQRLNV